MKDWVEDREPPEADASCGKGCLVRPNYWSLQIIEEIRESFCIGPCVDLSIHLGSWSHCLPIRVVMLEGARDFD